MVEGEGGSGGGYGMVFLQGGVVLVGREREKWKLFILGPNYWSMKFDD